MRTYRELEVVPIPEAIPELGIEEGALGTVDRVYANGRRVHVEVDGENGELIGAVDIDPYPEPHVVTYWDLR